MLVLFGVENSGRTDNGLFGIVLLPIELEKLENLKRIRVTQSMVPDAELEKFKASGFYDKIEF